MNFNSDELATALNGQGYSIIVTPAGRYLLDLAMMVPGDVITFGEPMSPDEFAEAASAILWEDPELERVMQGEPQPQISFFTDPDDDPLEDLPD
jgi:hypothetical protein